MDGMRNQIEPPAPIEQNLYELPIEALTAMGMDRLPKTLDEALDELEKDQVLMNALGDHIAKRYIATKREECARYAKSISQWELNEYLYKY